MTENNIEDMYLCLKNKRKDAQIEAHKKVIKRDLEKVGGIKRDVLDENLPFIVFLRIINKEGNKESYPLNIAKDIFNFSSNTDITKTSEYSKILRCIQRLEEIKVIFKSSEKLQHNISYIKVDYNTIISLMIKIVISQSIESNSTEKDFKELKYTDNKYIKTIVKLYYQNLSENMFFCKDYTLNQSLNDFIKYLFESIDENIIETIDGIEETYSELSDETSKENKKGFFMSNKEFEEKSSKIIARKKEDFFNEFKKNPVYNIGLGVQKYEKKDPKRATFFSFLLLLKRHYVYSDKYKFVFNRVSGNITNFIKIKYDPNLCDLDWDSQLLDLEDNLDSIHKFRFDD